MIFFFFNDTATTEIYTLSLHDALPISPALQIEVFRHYRLGGARGRDVQHQHAGAPHARSEEHTSELQSQSNLVCRLLLEKKQSDRSYFKNDVLPSLCGMQRGLNHPPRP